MIEKNMIGTPKTTLYEALFASKYMQLLKDLHYNKQYTQNKKILPLSKFVLFQDITISYGIKMVKILLKESLIRKIDIDKRSYGIELTDLGRELTTHIINIETMLIPCFKDKLSTMKDE